MEIHIRHFFRLNLHHKELEFQLIKYGLKILQQLKVYILLNSFYLSLHLSRIIF